MTEQNNDIVKSFVEEGDGKRVIVAYQLNDASEENARVHSLAVLTQPPFEMGGDVIDVLGEDAASDAGLSLSEMGLEPDEERRVRLGNDVQVETYWLARPLEITKAETFAPCLAKHILSRMNRLTGGDITDYL